MQGTPDSQSHERRLRSDRRGPDRRAIETRRLCERRVRPWPVEVDHRTLRDRRMPLERRGGHDRRLEHDRRDLMLRV